MMEELLAMTSTAVFFIIAALAFAFGGLRANKERVGILTTKLEALRLRVNKLTGVKTERDIKFKELLERVDRQDGDIEALRKDLWIVKNPAKFSVGDLVTFDDKKGVIVKIDIDTKGCWDGYIRSYRVVLKSNNRLYPAVYEEDLKKRTC